MVTVNEQVAELDDASVTLYTTVFAPTAKLDPLAPPDKSIVAGLGQLSNPVGAVYVTVAAQVLEITLAPVFAGHTIVGS